MAPSKHPLDSIVPDTEPANPTQSSGVSKIEMVNLQVDEQHPRTSPPAPLLSVDSIQAPAMLVNDRLRVVWLNKQANDRIWHRTGDISNGRRFPGLFDMLFDSEFQYHVENWRKWVAFFIQQALCIVSAENLRQLVDQMTDRQKDVIHALLDRYDTPGKRQAEKYRIRQVLNNGRIATYGIVSTGFSEGRLTVFEPQEVEDGSADRQGSYDIEARIEGIRRHPNPVKRSFSMMAANLNNAASLNLEMLGDDYSHLIHNLCQRCMATIEHYGGIFSQHLESGFFAYFLPLDRTDDHTMRAIECCLELKAEIAELSREWKVRKSWSHDIELNMGLHNAYEHVGIVTTYSGERVVSSGNALRTATSLSDWARNGQIWATKTLFKEMPPDTYKQLRFGVLKPDGQHRKVFLHRCFSLVEELPAFTPGSSGHELEGMAVTQIFNRQS